MPELTPAQERSVDLAIRAARYRTERDQALDQLRHAQAAAWLEGWLAGMTDAGRASQCPTAATPNPYRVQGPTS